MLCKNMFISNNKIPFSTPIFAKLTKKIINYAPKVKIFIDLKYNLLCTKNKNIYLPKKINNYAL